MTKICKKTFANTTLRRVWIIENLRIRGKSLSSLARDIGVSRQRVFSAVKLAYPGTRIAQAIADALGMEQATLFPERFDENGQPVSPQKHGRKKCIHKIRIAEKHLSPENQNSFLIKIDGVFYECRRWGGE